MHSYARASWGPKHSIWSLPAACDRTAASSDTRLPLALFLMAMETSRTHDNQGFRPSSMRLLLTLLYLFRGLESIDSRLESLMHEANLLHNQALAVARLTTTYSRRGRIRAMPHHYIIQSRGESKRILDTIDSLREDQKEIRGVITAVFGGDLERVVAVLSRHPRVESLETLIRRYESVPQFQSERRAMMSLPRSDEVSRRTDTLDERRALSEALTTLHQTVEQLASSAGSIDFMLGTLVRHSSSRSRRDQYSSSDQAMIDCCRSAEEIEANLRELGGLIDWTKSYAHAAAADRSLDELYSAANRVSAEELVQQIIEVEQHEFENAALRALKKSDLH